MLEFTIPGTDLSVPEPAGFAFTQATNIGVVLSALLNILFPIAGIVLLFMLISGGFGLLTSVGNPEGVKKAQGRISNALLGFLIIFLSFWIVQILATLFGIETIFSFISLDQEKVYEQFQGP